MDIVQRIWQENKRFLLSAGGGFALFLILNSCAVEGLVQGAAAQRDRNQKAEREVVKLQNQVFARAGEEEKSLTDLARIETELRGRYLTPQAASVPDPRKGAPQIQFSGLIDGIWASLSEKAKQRNVKLPEKITTSDLGVSQSDAAEDHERNASYLEVLGRALHACVDQGMVQIERPLIRREEELPIRKNEDAFVAYRRIALTVLGPYSSFKKVLKEFQGSSFVQVRLLSLDGKGAGGPALLKGQLEFVGVHLYREAEMEKEKEEKKKEAAREKKKRKPRQRK